MAGKIELDAAIAALITSIQAQITVINTEVSNASLAITEATNAISRLLGQIAAGTPLVDLQSEVDQLNGLKTSIDSAQGVIQVANDSLVSAVATFKVEGN